ncbi:Arrestin domain-containing protein 3 [Nymphon striatum]|nr:Arrestin domain-containing protein 3 [Nymphon striatum]
MGSLTSLGITFDNNQTVFLPGQHVRGKCVVNLKGSVKIRAITIVMKGVAKVHWSEPRGPTGEGGEHFNAKMEYFSRRLLLYGIEGALTATEVLSEGRHEYPFSFQLPSSGLSTSFEGTHGSIRYWMKAEIDKPWSKRLTHSTKKAFTVISHIDISRSEYQLPVAGNSQKTVCCWLCINDPISLHVMTDRKGFCAGESIAIRADFENLSRRKVIPYASLYQRQTFLAGGKFRKENKKLTAVKGGTIQPGKNIQWAAQLLKIPVVSPSISNCILIQNDYFVRVCIIK